jgi:hypothetical protein
MFDEHLVAERIQQQVTETVMKPADRSRPLSTPPMLPNLSRSGLVLSMMTLIWCASAKADQVAQSFTTWHVDGLFAVATCIPQVISLILMMLSS